MKSSSSKTRSVSVASMGLILLGKGAFFAFCNNESISAFSSVVVSPVSVDRFFFSLFIGCDFFGLPFACLLDCQKLLLVFSICSIVLFETTDLSFAVMSSEVAYLSLCLISSQLF